MELGAATDELVFSEIMLGQFGGLGEIEAVDMKSKYPIKLNFR